MKSPQDVATTLARQWDNNDLRTRRLLDDSQWPVEVPIPKPPPEAVAGRWAEVGAHLAAWQAVTVGEVRWHQVGYRATATPIAVPAAWRLRTPAEWVTATGNESVIEEYRTLSNLVAASPDRYHQILVRRRSLSLSTEPDEVTAAVRVAELVWPGCAGGLPLRILAPGGVDTKFFERNRPLLTALLDVRFEGAASERGLEALLGAAERDGPWLLVADLDGSLLPFPRLRATGIDLADRGLPGRRLLVVENEQCLHLLPPLEHTVAVLGAGQNLGWLATPRFDCFDVAYWGDLDTWGLRLLASARSFRPDLTALLMDADTFLAGQDRAVAEPTPADAPVAVTGRPSLTDTELELFTMLADRERGRLEQELLPAETVVDAVRTWATDNGRAAWTHQPGLRRGPTS